MRQQAVAAKTARARNELEDLEQRDSFTVEDDRYRGRQVMFDMPTPIHVERQLVRSVHLRYGVNIALLDELARGGPLIEQPLSESVAVWEHMIGSIKIESEPFSARMRIGSMFVSELSLRARPERTVLV